jgi:diaminopropionate ammonia-lyase
VLYKDEGPRFGLGSFKALGGSYAALKILQREISRALNDKASLKDIRNGEYTKEASKITLVSATDGNHGRSLAWGCKRFGAPCKIYIHAEVSEGRATAMSDLGAEVIRINGDYDDSIDFARSEAEKNNWFVVSDTSWPGYYEPPRDVMFGYGVMMHEVNEAMTQPPTHVFLQGGCGGFAGSATASLRQYWGDQAPRVVIVEPELANCLYESSKANKALFVKINEESIMAGLSCGQASTVAWSIIAEEASDFVTIPENVVAPTVRLLAKPQGDDSVIEAGESAVAGLAALICIAKQQDLREKLGLDETSRVLLIGSEGVTDTEIFKEIMEGGKYG